MLKRLTIAVNDGNLNDLPMTNVQINCLCPFHKVIIRGIYMHWQTLRVSNFVAFVEQDIVTISLKFPHI